jgi:5-methylcytosine-specific restriction endonuclease McrA
MRQKRPRLCLDTESYKKLVHWVLKRDGWRCQYCGRSEELEVHHMIPRSQFGHDTEENLITLCTGCHRKTHHQESTR